jgi:MEMO1 family protein
VAGQFYPNDRDELYEEIHRSFTSSIGPGRFPSISSTSRNEQKISRVECIIVPHAGYVYSGPVAAHSYKVAFDFFQKFRNEKRIIVIILGPNHYGIGSGVALSEVSSWRTPLGDVNLAKDLGKLLVSTSKIIDSDEIAHSREHSIEVQVPFIQAVAGQLISRISILPISLMLQDMETTSEISEEIRKLIEHKDEIPFLIIGSSDLTHYEPNDKASKKDHELLAEVEKLSTSSFYTVLERRNVSACGYGCISTVMQISSKLNKKKGILLKYSTSGETSGDMSSVVGYSAVHFTQ